MIYPNLLGRPCWQAISGTQLHRHEPCVGHPRVRYLRLRSNDQTRRSSLARYHFLQRSPGLRRVDMVRCLHGGQDGLALVSLHHAERLGYHQGRRVLKERTTRSVRGGAEVLDFVVKSTGHSEGVNVKISTKYAKSNFVTGKREMSKDVEGERHSVFRYKQGEVAKSRQGWEMNDN